MSGVPYPSGPAPGESNRTAPAWRGRPRAGARGPGRTNRC